MTVVKTDVAKALNEHFSAYNILAKQHFAEDSDDSDVEDGNMDVDSPPSPSKTESTSTEETDSPSKPEASADDTSNLQLAWEMLELAKVFLLSFSEKIKFLWRR